MARAKADSRHICRLVAGAVTAIGIGSGGANAQDVSDFYRGKTIHFLIGVGAGGDYDVQARLAARYLGKYIPGNPAIVTENMIGAGGLNMTNYLFNVAPKDGTYIGIIANNFPALQAVDGRGVQFDANRFQWLGALTPETHTMAVMSSVGVKTVEDAKQTEVIAGASGRGAITYTFPAMMNELIGTKFKIVTGYSGGADINLAMERGEVGARSNSWSSWKVTKPEWVKSGAITVLAQGGRRQPELANIPSVEDLGRTEDDRQVIRVLMLSASLGRPVAAPPGVPQERVMALRVAFLATTRDPGLLAEAKASRIEIEPVTGEEMQKLIVGVLATPKPLAARAKEFLE